MGTDWILEVSFVLPCFARATNEHCTKSPSTAQRSSCRAKAPLRYAFGRSTSSSFGTDSLNSQFFLYALFVFHRQNRIRVTSRVTSRDGADMLLRVDKLMHRELRPNPNGHTACSTGWCKCERAAELPQKRGYVIRKGRCFLCHARGLSVQLDSRVEVYCRVL